MAKADTYIENVDELRSETRRLYHNLSSRLSRMNKVLGANMPPYLKSNYDFIKERIGRNWNALSERELRSIYRDIQYTMGLKSSTLKGARHTQKVFEPIKEKLTSYSENTQERFWQVYERLYETSVVLIEHFKYEVMDTIETLIGQGHRTDYIYNHIINAYNKSLELGKDENESTKIFMESLNELRGWY